VPRLLFLNTGFPVQAIIIEETFRSTIPESQSAFFLKFRNEILKAIMINQPFKA
jgi:hypothetical protein